MILLLWIPICLFAFGSLLVSRENYYIRYSDFYNYTFILMLPIIFMVSKIKINDLRGIPIPLFLKVFIAIWLSYPLINYFNHLYIRLFGEETSYIVEVYDKRKEYKKDKIHSYIDVSAKNDKKTLDYAPLYLKVEVGSKLLINQKTSLVGYSIEYRDIQILKNE